MSCVHQAKLAAEEAKLKRQLDSQTHNLQQAQQQLDERLQGIQNKKQRVESDAASQQGKAETAARLKREQLATVSGRIWAYAC